MKACILLLLVMVTAAAAPVMAENREGAATLSPFFGGQIFSAGKEHIDADYTMGLRGGYNFTRNLGAELMLAYTETVYDPAVIHTNVFRYGADALYHFRPESPLVPLVAAGFGGITEDFASVKHDQTHLFFDYGCGLKYSLTDWLALRGDFRHNLVLDGLSSNYEISVGLNIQRGGH